jgi:putative Ca2+/H+ antiporter (TMEM165/GDT1 family)
MATKALSRRRQIAAGFVVIAVSLGVAAVAAIHLGKPPERHLPDAAAGLIAGLAFAFAGAILVVPERRVRIRASFGALMITFIALLFDWLAFGPGERSVTASFSGGTVGVRPHFWEMPGRILLVSGAMLFNLMALWAWIRARRAPRKRTSKA